MLLCAAWVGLEVSTSDLRVAFLHAVASEPTFAKPPVEQRAAGWLWPVKKAMSGMKTASTDFVDLVADAVKEIQFQRGIAHPQIYKDTKSTSSNRILGIFTSADSSRVETHRSTHVVERT